MPGPRHSRRRMLGAGAALLVAGPTVLAGCTGPTPAAPEEPDPLEQPARRAESDSVLAQAVAQAATEIANQVDGQALATVATALAADRMAHAITLRTELRRVRPTTVPSSIAPSAPPAPAPPPAIADLASARAALLQAVHSAQDEASQLVVTLPGYRAALLASVAACCASHAAVLP
ncbi:MAG: hypothetical protein M3302_10175 [Actinomycetota bacterium]|nr:hypothetical protein [Actinomycetota bacterium]